MNNLISINLSLILCKSSMFHLLYLSTPTLYFNVFPKPQFSLCSQISHNSFSFQSPTFVVQFLLCWCQLLNDHAKSEDVFPEVSVAISEVILWNTTLLKASHPQTGKQLSTTSVSKPGFRIVSASEIPKEHCWVLKTSLQTLIILIIHKLSIVEVLHS